MSMAVPTGAVCAAAGINVAPVTVELPPADERKPIPELFEIDKVPKVRVPAVLPCRLTPTVPPEHDVLPKFMSAVEAETSRHCVVLPERVVPPVDVRVPPI